MIDFGILAGIGIFGAIAYAIWASTQCDCVDLRGWNEGFDELSERDREMLTRVLS